MARPIPDLQELEARLSEPTEAVVEMMQGLAGDLILLGVGGKIGPSIARMAKRASDLVGRPRRIIGVSRFSKPGEAARLQSHGIEVIPCDLLKEKEIAQLPQVENVLYLAGFKFGSNGNMAATWVANAYLPGVVCNRFRSSRIVAYSTGNVYGLTPVESDGSKESDAPNPLGEYAMSCLGRERVFEHFCQANQSPTAIVRLFYACDLRYGVLVDLAQKILAGEPVDLSMGHFNVIWQGDSNALTLMAFAHAGIPARVINLTGLETLSTKTVALALGERLGRPPVFVGEPAPTACLGNMDLAQTCLGRPQVNAEELLDWVADWIRRGGLTLGKPTRFEVRDGRY